MESGFRGKCLKKKTKTEVNSGFDLVKLESRMTRSRIGVFMPD